MLRWKGEVRVGHFNEHLYVIFERASVWSALHKMDVQINSIADPAPGRVANSLHPFDLAVDCEPVGNAQVDRQSLAEWFRVQLPAGFDIVFETSHVHVEYDEHRGPLRELQG